MAVAIAALIIEACGAASLGVPGFVLIQCCLIGFGAVVLTHVVVPLIVDRNGGSPES